MVLFSDEKGSSFPYTSFTILEIHSEKHILLRDTYGTLCFGLGLGARPGYTQVYLGLFTQDESGWAQKII